MVQSLLRFFTDRLHDFRSARWCLEAMEVLLARHSSFLAAGDATSDEGAVRDARVNQGPAGEEQSDAGDATDHSHAGLDLLEDLAGSLFGHAADLHWPAMPFPCRRALYNVCLALTGLLRPFCASSPFVSSPPPPFSSTTRRGTQERAAALARQLFEGFLEAFEGEKDPRALAVALRLCVELQSLVSPPAQDWRVSDGQAPAAALASLLALYFPITFSPPPNDPHGITQARYAMPSSDPSGKAQRLSQREGGRK